MCSALLDMQTLLEETMSLKGSENLLILLDIVAEARTQLDYRTAAVVENAIRGMSW